MGRKGTRRAGLWRREAYFQMIGMKWAEMPAAENSERMQAASKTERRDGAAADDDAIGGSVPPRRGGRRGRDAAAGGGWPVGSELALASRVGLRGWGFGRGFEWKCETDS